jgi:hypothetical protein
MSLKQYRLLVQAVERAEVPPGFAGLRQAIATLVNGVCGSRWFGQEDRAQELIGWL